MERKELESIRKEWAAYVARHEEDIRKLRARKMKDGTSFHVVDKSIQDDAYNVLMEDYLEDYDKRLAVRHSEREKLQKKLEWISQEVRKRISDFESKNVVFSDVRQLQEALDSEKRHLDNLRSAVSELQRASADAEKEAKSGIDRSKIAYDEYMKLIGTYKERLDGAVVEYEANLRKYGEDRKSEFTDEIKHYVSDLQSAIDGTVKRLESELLRIHEEKRQQIVNFYDSIGLGDRAEKARERASRMSSIRDSIEESFSGLSVESIAEFLKYTLLLCVFILFSTYDYYFLSGILKNTFNNFFSEDDFFSRPIFEDYEGFVWTDLLALGIVAVLTVLFAMSSNIQKTIVRYSVKATVLLIIFALIAQSLFSNGEKVEITPLGVLLNVELILRLVMIPFLLVGDYILMEAINWDRFLLQIAKILKLAFFPVTILFHVFYLALLTLKQVTVGIFLEIGRWKFLRLAKKNEQTIVELIKPKIEFRPDLSQVTIDPSKGLSNPAETPELQDAASRFSKALEIASGLESLVSKILSEIDVQKQALEKKREILVPVNESVAKERELFLRELKHEVEPIVTDCERDIQKIDHSINAEKDNFKLVKQEMRTGILNGYAALLAKNESKAS